jgi:hypothetical protein
MEDEIIVRCSRLPPARLWCPPFHVRPAYLTLVPDVVPSTIEIAIMHRARCWERDASERGGRTEAPIRSPAVVTEPRTLPSVGVAEPASTVSAPPAMIQAGDGGSDGAGDDLSAFISMLLDDYGGRTAPRVVCRGDRPIELRLQPALVFRLLGEGERAQTVVRRWAAHRWVRQVRPVFVLERTALDTLDPDLRRRLAAHHRSAAVVPPFPKRAP